MTVYRDFSRSKWFVAALLVAAAQAAIAPSSAQAECGDYVILGGHGAYPNGAHSDRAHLDGAQLDGAQRDVGPVGPLHRGRCSGPNCSNDSPRPLDKPTVPTVTNVRQWGLMAVQRVETSDVTRFAQFADDASLPRAAASSVFRPPR